MRKLIIRKNILQKHSKVFNKHLFLKFGTFISSFKSENFISRKIAVIW